MQAFTIIAASLAALVQAVPHSHQHLHRRARAVEARDGPTFELKVHNNCSSSKSFGLYQVSSSFDMIQMSTPVTIEPNSFSVIQAPYHELGMRLSGDADNEDQWSAQTLFEFGFSAYSNLQGTAYDLSVMEGAEEEGIAAYPATSECESKVCSSLGCALAEAWTDATQAADGSPADTVCYQGKQDFRVVWCPQ